MRTPAKRSLSKPSQPGPSQRERVETKPEDTKPANPTVAAFAAVTKAVQEFFAGIISSISWAVVALIVLVALRRQIIGVLHGLIAAMQERSVSLDVGAVKIQVAERGPESIDEVRPIYSPSPFELDEPLTEKALPLLSEIEPQSTFRVSDRVARYWTTKGSLAAAADTMRLNREKLRAISADVTMAAVAGNLLPYVRSLEAARFLEATQLASWLGDHHGVNDAILALKPTEISKERDDCLLLYATAIAFAQNEDASRAFVALDRLAWAADKPFYLPAASSWLMAAYHSLLANLKRTTPDVRVESPEVLDKIRALLDRADQLVNAIDGEADWNRFGVMASKGYYVREAHKSFGVVLSGVADQVSPPHRDQFLKKAALHLERCTQEIDGDPPSSLDQNNFADLQRQRGELLRLDGKEHEAAALFGRAREAIDRAFQDGRPGDPLYHDTLARIYASERRFREAWMSLEEYSAVNAVRSNNPQDVEQYLDNQILASKLALVTYEGEVVRGLSVAAAILEGARDFLRRSGHLLNSESKVADHEAQVCELLAFAYLQIPRSEQPAAESFKRLFAIVAWRPGETKEVRSRIGWATALGRIARLHRLQISPATAAAFRKSAIDALKPAFAELEARKGDLTLPSPGRRSSLGIWIDGVRAMQLLAEERFAGSEMTDARALAEAEAPLLATLEESVQQTRPPDENGPARAAVQRVVARHGLLSARLLFQTDPTLKQADTITKIELILTRVQGDALFECQRDLEIGFVRLTSAMWKRGDPSADYRESIAAFERAAGRDVPSLRADVIDALARAHALRPSILRAAKTASMP